MNTILIVGGIAVAAGALLLLILKSASRREEPVEVAEEEEELPIPGIKVEEEQEEGCPPAVKEELLRHQERLYRDAKKVYLVLNQLLQNKTLPDDVKREFELFLRSYNRIKELKEEIEVYPFSDCNKVFHLKFNFYDKLLKETAQKLMVMAKALR